MNDGIKSAQSEPQLAVRVLAKRERISPDTLKRYVRYDPNTGSLIWLERPGCSGTKGWNQRFANTHAGTKNRHGYMVFSLDGTKIMAHVAAWAIYYGAWPGLQVSHKNGNRSDNRIDNLQEGPHQFNHMSVKKPVNNTSGHVGVRRLAKTGKYEAYIKVNQRYRYIGTYPSFDLAQAARSAEQTRLGFSEDHGRKA